MSGIYDIWSMSYWLACDRARQDIAVVPDGSLRKLLDNACLEAIGLINQHCNKWNRMTPAKFLEIETAILTKHDDLGGVAKESVVETHHAARRILGYVRDEMGQEGIAVPPNPEAQAAVDNLPSIIDQARRDSLGDGPPAPQSVP